MTKFSLKKHLKRSHATSKPFYCELCPEGFQKPDDRMQHMAQEHEKDFKCVHCNLQFYLSSDYVEHMSSTHKVKITLEQAKKKSDVDVPMERLRFIPEKLNEDIIVSFLIDNVRLVINCLNSFSRVQLNHRRPIRERQSPHSMTSLTTRNLRVSSFTENSSERSKEKAN